MATTRVITFGLAPDVQCALDDRAVFATIADRNALRVGRAYNGLIAYVVSDQTLYALIDATAPGQDASWVAVAQQGPEGPQGPPGRDGTNGVNGMDGAAGPGYTNLRVNATTGIINADAVNGASDFVPTNIRGPQGDAGPSGQDGRDGVNGQRGQDGQTPILGAVVGENAGLTTIQLTSTINGVTTNIGNLIEIRDGQAGSDTDSRIPMSVTIGNFPRFSRTDGTLEQRTPDQVRSDISAANVVHTHTHGQITDFDAGVSSNTDVISNTAKRGIRDGAGTVAVSNGNAVIPLSDNSNFTITGIGQGGGGGGGGATNLDSVENADNVLITSSTGTSATIPGATATSAGVLTSTDKTKLDALMQNDLTISSDADLPANVLAELNLNDGSTTINTNLIPELRVGRIHNFDDENFTTGPDALAEFVRRWNAASAGDAGFFDFNPLDAVFLKYRGGDDVQLYVGMPLTVGGGENLSVADFRDLVSGNTLTASQADDRYIRLDASNANNTTISNAAANTLRTALRLNTEGSARQTIAANTSGTAAFASQLSPGRNINGVLFNGTQDITIPDTHATISDGTNTVVNPTTITYSVGAQGEGLLVGGTDNGPATVRLPFDETSDLSALTNEVKHNTSHINTIDEELQVITNPTGTYSFGTALGGNWSTLEAYYEDATRTVTVTTTDPNGLPDAWENLSRGTILYGFNTGVTPASDGSDNSSFRVEVTSVAFQQVRLRAADDASNTFLTSAGTLSFGIRDYTDSQENTFFGGLRTATVTAVNDALVQSSTDGSLTRVAIGNNLTLSNGTLSATGNLTPGESGNFTASNVTFGNTLGSITAVTDDFQLSHITFASTDDFDQFSNRIGDIVHLSDLPSPLSSNDYIKVRLTNGGAGTQIGAEVVEVTQGVIDSTRTTATTGLTASLGSQSRQAGGGLTFSNTGDSISVNHDASLSTGGDGVVSVTNPANDSIIRYGSGDGIQVDDDVTIPSGIWEFLTVSAGSGTQAVTFEGTENFPVPQFMSGGAVSVTSITNSVGSQSFNFIDHQTTDQINTPAIDSGAPDTFPNWAAAATAAFVGGDQRLVDFTQTNGAAIPPVFVDGYRLNAVDTVNTGAFDRPGNVVGTPANGVVRVRFDGDFVITGADSRFSLNGTGTAYRSVTTTITLSRPLDDGDLANIISIGSLNAAVEFVTADAYDVSTRALTVTLGLNNQANGGAADGIDVEVTYGVAFTHNRETFTLTNRAFDSTSQTVTVTRDGNPVAHTFVISGNTVTITLDDVSGQLNSWMSGDSVTVTYNQAIEGDTFDGTIGVVAEPTGARTQVVNFENNFTAGPAGTTYSLQTASRTTAGDGSFTLNQLTSDTFGFRVDYEAAGFNNLPAIVGLRNEIEQLRLGRSALTDTSVPFGFVPYPNGNTANNQDGSNVPSDSNLRFTLPPTTGHAFGELSMTRQFDTAAFRGRDVLRGVTMFYGGNQIGRNIGRSFYNPMHNAIFRGSQVNWATTGGSTLRRGVSSIVNGGDTTSIFRTLEYVIGYSRQYDLNQADPVHRRTIPSPGQPLTQVAGFENFSGWGYGITAEDLGRSTHWVTETDPNTGDRIGYNEIIVCFGRGDRGVNPSMATDACLALRRRFKFLPGELTGDNPLNRPLTTYSDVGRYIVANLADEYEIIGGSIPKDITIDDVAGNNFWMQVFLVEPALSAGYSPGNFQIGQGTQFGRREIRRFSGPNQWTGIPFKYFQGANVSNDYSGTANADAQARPEIDMLRLYENAALTPGATGGLQRIKDGWDAAVTFDPNDATGRNSRLGITYFRQSNPTAVVRESVDKDIPNFGNTQISERQTVALPFNQTYEYLAISVLNGDNEISNNGNPNHVATALEITEIYDADNGFPDDLHVLSHQRIGDLAAEYPVGIDSTWLPADLNSASINVDRTPDGGPLPVLVAEQITGATTTVAAEVGLTVDTDTNSVNIGVGTGNTANGSLRVRGLSGTGTRNVGADADGNLVISTGGATTDGRLPTPTSGEYLIGNTTNDGWINRTTAQVAGDINAITIGGTQHTDIRNTALLTGGFLLTEMDPVAGQEPDRDRYNGAIAGFAATDYWFDNTDGAWFDAEAGGTRLIGF